MSERSDKWEKWSSLSSSNRNPEIKFDIGDEFTFTIKDVMVVGAHFGGERYGLVAKFIVEVNSKIYTLFPHADLKRKLLAIQKAEPSKTLENVTVKVKLKRRLGNMFVYEVEKV